MDINWELGVGAVGVLLAILSLVLQHHRDRELAKVQLRITSIEEARRGEELESRRRAPLTLRLESTVSFGGQSQRSLVLHNPGPAIARNITVQVKEDTSGKMPLVMTDKGVRPIPLVHPGQDYEVAAILHWEPQNTSFAIGLIWQDENGPKSEDFHFSL